MAQGSDVAREIEELGFEPSAFEALENDFQEALGDLKRDATLDGFRSEYEKLYKALKESHSSERRLVKKCRELNSEISTNMGKVQTATKLSQDDQNTIAQLKRDIDKANKNIDQSKEREARVKETKSNLQSEIDTLRRKLEAGASATHGQESAVRDLTQKRDDMQNERDNVNNQIVALRQQLQENSDKVRSLQQEKLGGDQEMTALRSAIEGKKSEVEKELKRKERLENELKDLKLALEHRQIDIKKKQNSIKLLNEDISQKQQAIREQKQDTDKAYKDFESLNTKWNKLGQDLEDQIHTNTQLLAENSQRQVEIKNRHEDMEAIKAESKKNEAKRDASIKKVKQLEDQRAEVEQQKDELKAQISRMEMDIEMQKKERTSDDKTIEDLVRERDILNKNLVKATGATQKQDDLVKINENTKKTLEQDIIAFKAEAQKQRKMIFQLEKEREKYATEATEASRKYSLALDEVKDRDKKVMELQKMIADGDTKLKQQQNLYEAVRSDRNLYSKNLIESQDEINEMKRKFKIMNHQIEQLKEEIESKDKALVKEHFDHMKVDKDKEQLKLQLDGMEKEIVQADQEINNLKSEVAKLNHIINEADTERLKQKKEYDVVINERDILGNQLIKRNEELAELYENIKIQQSTLNKGERQYMERLHDIKELKNAISDLRMELSILRSSVANLGMLKGEVYHLGRELLQERTKVKALSEELENPMNVHRWRELEGSDPNTYNMIKKIHTVQKRLIAKTEEVSGMDSLIQEKEKLYVELKNILARQPGPEVAEQLLVYQHNLSEKQKQMKAMTMELNMYRSQVGEQKEEADHLDKEIQSCKDSYVGMKKRERRANQAAAMDISAGA